MSRKVLRHFQGYSTAVFSNTWRIFVTTVLAVMLSACMSMPTKQDFQGGFEKLKTKMSSRASKTSDNTAQIVGKYPTNQVPHTLLKKPVAEGRLTSGHGYRFSPTGVPMPKKHKGLDYAAPTGTPVYAAGDGIIVKRYVSDSYGNYIRIEHDNGFFTAYAHMQAFADGLDVGSPVTKGQMIGNVGSTGRSSGPHLHFELIHGSTAIDPLFETVVPVESASN